MPHYQPITFEITIPGEEPRIITMTEPTIKVGSLSSAGLHLDHESVSRMHAYIQQDAGQFYVSDLGSARGTVVNGHRVNKAKLQNGDTLELGDVEVAITLDEAPGNPKPRHALRPAGKIPIDPSYPTAEPKIYYCERCFHVRGEIVEMDDTFCPVCNSDWRLSRGQARHVVSMKLQHYRMLAQELGIKEEQDQRWDQILETIQKIMLQMLAQQSTSDIGDALLARFEEILAKGGEEASS